MRSFFTSFVFFSLFALAQAGVLDDLVQQYEDDGERLCVQVNTERITVTREPLAYFTIGFIDGFYSCETRNTNIDGSGLAQFGFSLYGIGGMIGKVTGQTFIGLAAFFL